MKTHDRNDVNRTHENEFKVERERNLGVHLTARKDSHSSDLASVSDLVNWFSCCSLVYAGSPGIIWPTHAVLPIFRFPLSFMQVPHLNQSPDEVFQKRRIHDRHCAFHIRTFDGVV